MTPGIAEQTHRNAAAETPQHKHAPFLFTTGWVVARDRVAELARSPMMVVVRSGQTISAWRWRRRSSSTASVPRAWASAALVPVGGRPVRASSTWVAAVGIAGRGYCAVEYRYGGEDAGRVGWVLDIDSPRCVPLGSTVGQVRSPPARDRFGRGQGAEAMGRAFDRPAFDHAAGSVVIVPSGVGRRIENTPDRSGSRRGGSKSRTREGLWVDAVKRNLTTRPRGLVTSCPADDLLPRSQQLIDGR